MGWGSCGPPPEPADEGKGVKPQLNAGSSAFKGGEAHTKRGIVMGE